MADETVYLNLATALDGLPNGFPRTKSGVELKILRKLFSPEEASLASLLNGDGQSAATVATLAGLPVRETGARLKALARRGFVWSWKGEAELLFRLAPFIVGIYEARAIPMDHEYSHLIEDYLAEGGAVGIMGPEPALHRVIPAQGTVKTEWILPYDNVRALLESARTFTVNDCICREQQEQLGHRHCDFPLRNCLSFSAYERRPHQGDISREEALAILAESEKLGLVHTVSNVTQGVGYVCNCCGCCCGLLRGIAEWGIEHSVAYANYFACIENGDCTGCGICCDRCQVGAIEIKNGAAVVDKKRCIGCGLCATGCPSNAAKLHRKPEDEIVAPPVDYIHWERERRKNRGLHEHTDNI